MSDDAFYHDFAQALNGGDARAVSQHLASDVSVRRFLVYRNNVVRGAIDALRAGYPAVERLVGGDFFAPMAKTFWQGHPPRSPSLTLYGASFSDFIRTYPPARSLPWLADVARHDRAWLEAHHSRDEPVFGPGDAVALDGMALADQAPGLHASARLILSDWPGYEIWRRNRFETEPARLQALPGAWFSVVWRRRGDVRHRALAAADYAFLLALRDGRSVGEAADIVLNAHDGFDPASAFATALADEILRGNIHER